MCQCPYDTFDNSVYTDSRKEVHAKVRKGSFTNCCGDRFKKFIASRRIAAEERRDGTKLKTTYGYDYATLELA
jgi:hypothetical protein